jgi:hypothetical protein
MKKTQYIYIVLVLLSFSLPVSLTAGSSGQEQTRISPYMLFSYLKDTDSHKILQVRMTNILPTGEVPLPGLPVKFYNGGNLLGEAMTDAMGNASHTVSDTVQLYMNADRSWPFSALFEGDSLIDQASAELSITDVNLEMTLSEEEGKKIVTLEATTPAENGTVPVAGEEISVYVPRLFSLLPVGTGTFEDDGTVQITFPDDVPGDSTGNITVIGRFNDHYLFGNVEKREVKAWGKAVTAPPAEYRSLWSTLAPKWMVVTLAIMLIGVWSHYMYVLISLARIKRSGKKDD